MAQKQVWLEGIGPVILAKRRGTRNLRLSISADGRVRVGMPAWVAYSTGIKFAESRKDWIIKNLATKQRFILKNGSRIGKSYRLSFTQKSESATRATLRTQTIQIVSPLPLEHDKVQDAAIKASEKALKKEASALLPARLASLAKRHGFVYKSVKIKRLTSRWGSCSSDKTITLNYFLMQLPWHLIDYVIIHELIHTRHLNHSQDFWSSFEKAFPSAKRHRRELKDFNPVINATA